jgi:hypothetical protein
VAYGRFGAATGHVALANTINQAIPFAGMFALSAGTRGKKMFLMALTFFLVIAVITTKSRGGFIGLLVSGAGFAYLNRENKKNLIVIAAIGGLLLLYSGASYIAHMSTITDGVFGSRSATDRYMGLVNGISMMIKRPILGAGIGCFAYARLQYFGYYFYSHNLYGELFGELGLASVTWFYWIYAVWSHCKRLKARIPEDDENGRFYRHSLTAIQFSLVVRLVIGNFTHGWYIWFWFLMAAMCVSIERLLPEKEALASEENTSASQEVSLPPHQSG